MRHFSDFSLLPSLQRTLTSKGLVTATQIQSRAMPLMLEGKSVVGVARTGTGKTLAYVLPILHRLKTLEKESSPVTETSSPRAAVVAPTRELAEQISRVFKQYTHDTRIRVRSVVGGTTVETTKKNLSGAFDIVVATPGRLVQLMDRKLIRLSDVRILILDEADQMMDPSFLEMAKRIAKECDGDVQMGLFSATVSPTVQALVYEFFSGAEIIQPKNAPRFSPGLETKKVMVANGVRFPFLEAELAKPANGGTLIFVNTREQCDELARKLKEAGHPCLVCRGEMDRLERRANFKAFRERKIDLLVSTDLASRGLDVEHVYRVINYHLPQTMENYIHRVGRTARAGRKGLVVNLVTPRDHRLMSSIQA